MATLPTPSRTPSRLDGDAMALETLSPLERVVFSWDIRLSHAETRRR
jgi:hypothetical protein